MLADLMRNRDFLADWPGRRDKALKPGLSRLKRDIWYAYTGLMKDHGVHLVNQAGLLLIDRC